MHQEISFSLFSPEKGKSDSRGQNQDDDERMDWNREEKRELTPCHEDTRIKDPEKTQEKECVRQDMQRKRDENEEE